MYVIMKPIEDTSNLQYSHDIFYCDEATGNPHVFSSIEDADSFREEHQLDGKIIELLIK